MASSNAVAGPSHVGAASQTSSSSSAAASFPAIQLAAYLPPDPAPPRPRSVIHPTNDLIGRYGIIPAYDEFVRPFNIAPIPIEDKGKRKEDAPVGDATDETRSGPKEGLFQHGYKHFIKDLGLGKHNHRKDTFLTDLMLNPEKQSVPIVKLDRVTFSYAFNLKEGGVPGFNASALTGDDEKRKKKKKKRPIDPAQPSSTATPILPAAAIPSASAPAPIPAPAPARRPPAAVTQPANGHAPPTQSRPSVPAQRPPPQPQRHPLPPIPKTAGAAARPPGAGQGTGASGATGVKRKDREDGGTNGHTVNGKGAGATGAGGTGTALKPAKKRKMDPMAYAPQHHVHQQVVQQPTPRY